MICGPGGGWSLQDSGSPQPNYKVTKYSLKTAAKIFTELLPARFVPTRMAIVKCDGNQCLAISNG